MNSHQRALYKKTRDTSFLLTLFIAVLGAGLVVALVFHWTNFRPGLPLYQRYMAPLIQGDLDEAAAVVRGAMEEAEGDPAEVADNLRQLTDLLKLYLSKPKPQLKEGKTMEDQICTSVHLFYAGGNQYFDMEEWPIEEDFRSVCADYFTMRLIDPGQEAFRQAFEDPEVPEEAIESRDQSRSDPGGPIVRTWKRFREEVEKCRGKESHPVALAMYGDILLEALLFDEARAAFEEAIALDPDSVHARSQMFKLAMDSDDMELLAALTSDPDYRGKAEPLLVMQALDRQEKWGSLLVTCFRYVIEGIPQGRWALALAAGAIWFLVLLKGAGFLDWKRRRSTILLCLAGVVLGVLSIAPTLWCIFWQERVWGIEQGSRVVDGAVYFIGGVGLREEFCKLLLLLPLVPLLVKRGNNMEMLVVASCVGLGFAIEENLNYIQSQPGKTVIARFLTANFFHMFLTGLIGFAFCKFVQNPRKWFDHFLFVFVSFVILHGVYDLFLDFERYTDAEALNMIIAFPFLSFILFLVYSRQYFHQFSALRDDTLRQVVSPLAFFAVGLALLFTLAFNYASLLFGPYDAFRVTGSTAFQLAPVAYFFYQCFQKA